jgi:hypothetical protein
MSIDFHAEMNPSRELFKEVERSAPTDPFFTSAFAEALRSTGQQPWMLLLRQKKHVVSACPAFVTNGRLNRSLEIMSLPQMRDSEKFWDGVVSLCRQARISHLKANGFISSVARIPTLEGEIRRRTRTKYVLDPKEPNLWFGLSENHRRNIKRGRNAQLQVRRASGEDACRQHSSLVLASMARRERRGERVSADAEVRTAIAFTQGGAGELFQALLGDRVVASILVLMANKGAYYESAGTNADGMSCGAAHFLVYETVGVLKEQGVEIFNLGGADPQLNPGLERFKTGFGAVKTELESAEFFLGNKVRQKLGIAASLMRSATHFINGP